MRLFNAIIGVSLVDASDLTLYQMPPFDVSFLSVFRPGGIVFYSPEPGNTFKSPEPGNTYISHD